MKRALEEQTSEQAVKRRKLASKFVCAMMQGLGSSQSKPLHQIIDENIKNIKINTRGRQKIVHTRTSLAKPGDKHPSGAYLSHMMATGGLSEHQEDLDSGLVKEIANEKKLEAKKHYDWTVHTLNDIFNEEDDTSPSKTFDFFGVWDVNTIEKRANQPEMAQSNARIVSIHATLKHKSVIRTTVVMDIGTLKHLYECMDEGTEKAGMLCYIVIPPQNRFMVHNIRHACRAGRHTDEKIEKMILYARQNNCAIRISQKLFDKNSAHYIPGFAERLEKQFPGFMQNLFALPLYYQKVLNNKSSEAK